MVLIPAPGRFAPMKMNPPESAVDPVQPDRIGVAGKDGPAAAGDLKHPFRREERRGACGEPLERGVEDQVGHPEDLLAAIDLPEDSIGPVLPGGDHLERPLLGQVQSVLP